MNIKFRLSTTSPLESYGTESLKSISSPEFHCNFQEPALQVKVFGGNFKTSSIF